MRTICFVGSAELFSEIVLRTVEAGLDRVRALRMPDMATLGLVLNDSADFGPLAKLCAVVCDERNATAMMALADREPARFADLTPVIAFEDDAFACDLLANQRTRIVDQRISLLPMNLNLASWVSLLQLIGSGGQYVPPQLLGLERSARAHSELPQAHAPQSTDQAAACAGSADIATLTPRETEVLAMAAEGAPNKEIAHALDLSEHTVKLHMHRVIAKLGVKNRTEASVWFHQRIADA